MAVLSAAVSNLPSPRFRSRGLTGVTVLERQTLPMDRQAHRRWLGPRLLSRGEVGVGRCSHEGVVPSRECRRGFYELRHFGASYMPNEPEPYGHPDKGRRIDRIRRALGENVGTFRSGSGESRGKAVSKGA